jgi:hypothetical protein
MLEFFPAVAEDYSVDTETAVSIYSVAAVVTGN